MPPRRLESKRESNDRQDSKKFRGHCQFKMYRPAKPEKYGNLFHVITHAFHCYVYKMIPYTGLPNKEFNAAYKKSTEVGGLFQALTVDF